VVSITMIQNILQNWSTMQFP